MEDQRIIELLAELVKDMKKIICLMENGRPDLPVDDQWIDSLEVQNLLGITRKTVYRLTKNGTLVPRPIGRRKYYSRSAIFTLKNRFLK